MHHIANVDPESWRAEEQNPVKEAGSGRVQEQIRRKQRPRVRFDSTPKIVSTIGLHQLTDGEISSMWYNHAAYDVMRKDMKRVVKMLRKAVVLPGINQEGLEENEQYSFRGLEHLQSKRVLEETQRCQRLCIGAVLYAQNQAQCQGFGLNDTSMLLSEASMAFSHGSKEQAIKMATKDTLALTTCYSS